MLHLSKIKAGNKKTKIVATIGPPSESKEKLKEMIKSGLNVARLNFSHNDHSWHQKVIDNVRSVSEELGTNVGIMGDLQGPRIRVSTGSDIDARRGKEILVSDVSFRKNIDDFSSEMFFLDYPGIIKELKEGHEILIEDGIIRLRVIKKEKKLLRTKVIDGGIIKNHKGVNIPAADLSIDVITEKDKKDLKFLLKNEVDFIALSFVKSGNDIARLRNMIKKELGRDQDLPHIVSKIERAEAIENLEEIIDETDVVMVARGDLATETSPAHLAVYQKKIVASSLRKATPVIMATEMLNSMIDHPRPTRAEISDVSNAVIDHSDAVMLSGETANGKYPVETVGIMSSIIHSTEESPYDDIYKVMQTNIESDYAIIIKSAYELAKSFDTKAIAMISVSGFTARLISHFRPDQEIFVATNNQKTHHQMSIVWGVDSYYFKEENLEVLIDKLLAETKKDKKLKKGDKVVVILGRVPCGEKMRLVGIREIK
ncbi:MAG: pyruvate kinase [Candidatus Moranbacteria bacterium]|nr:pyruvate kinase [Candidatus Moranbacteria bacterium]